MSSHLDHYPYNIPTEYRFYVPVDETWREFYTFYYWSSKQIGISDITKDNSSITLYPNPTTGELRIENGELKIENVEVYDIYGKRISSHHLLPTSSHHLINISHLTAGIYFVNIHTATGEIVRKIVKN